MASEDDKPVRDFTSEASTSNRNRQNKSLEQFRQGYKGKGTWGLSGDKKSIVGPKGEEPAATEAEKPEEESK